MIAITSDIHFYSGRGNTKQVSEDEIFEVFNQIVQSCKEYNIKHLYILGDLFHVRGKIHTTTFNRVYDMFKEITASGIEIGLLSGNHDQVHNDDEKTTSIYSLQEIKGISLINWKNFQHENCNFVGIPYVNTKAEYLASLEKCQVFLQKNMTNILFTHGVISGSAIGSGYSFSKSLGVDAGLESFNLVLAGHVHIPQILFKNKAIVTGSPLAHTKKDLSFPQVKDSPTNNPRGFWIMDTETGELQLQPTVYNRFLKYNITSRNELDNILKNWNKRDFLFFTVDTPEIDTTDRLVTNYINDKIEWDFVCPTKDNEIRLDVDMGASEKEIVETFIDIKSEGYDKSLLLKIANELLEEYEILQEKV